MIWLYLYKYLLLWDIPYIIGNGLMSAFQHKFDCVNPSSRSWDISKWRFYSYWWSDILVVCCCFCTSHICADSLHLGLSVRIVNDGLSFASFLFYFEFLFPFSSFELRQRRQNVISHVIVTCSHDIVTCSHDMMEQHRRF